MLRSAIIIAACLALGVSVVAAAKTTVRVLATDPPGSNVLLGSNQNFYVHIGYSTDQPIQIWARPYAKGVAVNAGNNPSRTYTGSGEALGWFFLMQAGDTVDEVRITAGDGSRDGTHLVATYPVHVVGGASPAVAHTEPDWVTRLNRIDQAAQRTAYEQRMNTPATPGDVVLFSGFMLAMLGLGLLGFAAPAWALARWRGGWRVAAAAPAVLMGFVVLRIAVETAADPTSHNLWPFEVLQAGTLSVIAIVILYFARRRAGAS